MAGGPACPMCPALDARATNGDRSLLRALPSAPRWSRGTPHGSWGGRCLRMRRRERQRCRPRRDSYGTNASDRNAGATVYQVHAARLTDLDRAGWLYSGSALGTPPRCRWNGTRCRANPTNSTPCHGPGRGGSTSSSSVAAMPASRHPWQPRVWARPPHSCCRTRTRSASCRATQRSGVLGSRNSCSNCTHWAA